MRSLILSITILALLAAGCNPGTMEQSSVREVTPPAVTTPTATPDAAPSPSAVPTATSIPAATSTPAASKTPLPTATATPVGLGPDVYPTGINPLTGLPVTRPDLLELPPVLISVSNFPVTARPQSGLSNAAMVFEVYTGWGMTRYAAIYYGDMPLVNGKPLEVGPIRSGRLPYEHIRQMMNGFMLIANGDETVLKELNAYTNVWGAVNDVNGVFVTGELIEKIAKGYQAGLGKPQISGLTFSKTPPEGGKGGKMLWVPYTSPNQVFWRYDSAGGVYNRTQDNYDGLTFTKMTDRQTGKLLAFDNVVVLFAFHNALQDEKIEIGLGGVSKAPALLFRDGKMYEIFWASVDQEYSARTGRSRMLRFFDSNGNLVPLKPGKTWAEVVTMGSEYYETVDSQVYTELMKKSPGTGAWAVRFIAPVVKKK